MLAGDGRPRPGGIAARPGGPTPGGPTPGIPGGIGLPGGIIGPLPRAGGIPLPGIGAPGLLVNGGLIAISYISYSLYRWLRPSDDLNYRASSSRG